MSCAPLHKHSKHGDAFTCVSHVVTVYTGHRIINVEVDVGSVGLNSTKKSNTINKYIRLHKKEIFASFKKKNQSIKVYFTARENTRFSCARIMLRSSPLSMRAFISKKAYAALYFNAAFISSCN